MYLNVTQKVLGELLQSLFRCLREFRGLYTKAKSISQWKEQPCSPEPAGFLRIQVGKDLKTARYDLEIQREHKVSAIT